MKQFVLALFLFRLITTPTCAHAEELSLASFSNDREKFCQAVQDKLEVDVFEMAVYCQHIKWDDSTVNSYILENTLLRGLEGICSVESDEIRRKAGLKQASAGECITAALKVRDESLNRKIFPVFVNSYNRTKNTEEGKSWIAAFSVALDYLYAPYSQIRWSHEDERMMDIEMERMIVTHKIMSNRAIVGASFVANKGTPSAESCQHAYHYREQTKIWTDENAAKCSNHIESN